MDEIGLTNNELLTIVKEASKNSGLSFERILEALVRTEDTGALHPDDF
jgi:hypothetical protein